MISPVSSNQQVQAIANTAQKPQAAAPAPKPAQDTVQLSPQALAAAKSQTANHDGDNH
jgi:hypothetical protein